MRHLHDVLIAAVDALGIERELEEDTLLGMDVLLATGDATDGLCHGLDRSLVGIHEQLRDDGCADALGDLGELLAQRAKRLRRCSESACEHLLSKALKSLVPVATCCITCVGVVGIRSIEDIERYLHEPIEISPSEKS